MKNVQIPLCLATLVAGSALGAVGCRHEAKAGDVGQSEPKVHLETSVASERRIPVIIPLTGTLAAYQRTDLAANASGRVIRTFVERGQRVTRGQVLAQLDTRSAQLGVDVAKANADNAVAQRDNAHADCARYDLLIAKGAITRQEYDKAVSQCRATTASAAAARVQTQEAVQSVADATIRAPFAGFVSERFVSVGDYVKQDARVVTLLVDDSLRLELTVPEASLRFVHEGQQLSFQTVALPDREFAATVRFLGKEVRSNTRDLVFEATASNADHALVPGMFVTVKLAAGSESLPVVPKSALLETSGNPTVFAVVGGRLQRRAVFVAATLGDDVAIRDGLRSGERVVSHPSEATPDGALIQ